MSSNIPQKVLFRWIQSSLQYNGIPATISSLDDLRDGIVLAQLTQTLVPNASLKVSMKPSTQKMVVIGRIQTVLNYISDQKVRVTCSPDEIYDGNENMILGLIWVLILQFQVIHKAKVMKWVQETTNQYLESKNLPLIEKVEKSFQHGRHFCALINAIRPEAIDINSIGGENSSALAKAAFSSADEMGIPQLLDVGDSYDDKSLLLYFSYFYNKFKDTKFEPPPEDNSKVEELLEKIAELEGNLGKANDTIAEMAIKAEKELGELQESQEALEKELEDTKKENEIVEKKVMELTLKMPFFLKKEQSSTPPPEGEVTLVFTDVQSSTLQWEHRPDAMAASLAIHNQMMRDLIQKHGGYEVKTEGDAFMIAFSSATSAVKWCLETQQELLKQDWPEKIYEGEDSAIEEVDGQEIYRGLRVRMGVHTGEPKAERDPVTGRMDYFGPMVNRSARVEGTAHGGQIVLSGECFEAIQESVANKEIEEFETIDMGEHTLKGLQTDTHLHQILPISLVKRKFPEYGAKPAGEEESEGADIMAEMEQLAKENEHLKAKMSDLEKEAQEAIKKAEDLGKWLDEIQEDLPPSLSKELLSASKNIGKLMKSQAMISGAIEQTTLENIRKKEELRKTKQHYKAAKKRIVTLEETVKKNEEQIEEYERMLNERKKGFIHRIIGTKRDDRKKNSPPVDQAKGDKTKKEKKKSRFRSASKPTIRYSQDKKEYEDVGAGEKPKRVKSRKALTDAKKKGNKEIEKRDDTTASSDDREAGNLEEPKKLESEENSTEASPGDKEDKDEDLSGEPEISQGSEGEHSDLQDKKAESNEELEDKEENEVEEDCKEQETEPTFKENNKEGKKDSTPKKSKKSSKESKKKK